MTGWKLHHHTADNLFFSYQCGLKAGQMVALRQDLIVHQHGIPTGQVHRRGEVWQVLPSVKTDPVVWLRQPDGERCTWDDDAAEINAWFEVVE